MVHFLRDHKNNTIVDCDASADDIGCLVDIQHYSIFLLHNLTRTREIVADFAAIQEIRGEFFESGWKGTPDELAEVRVRVLADKYGLVYVTD